MSKTLKEQIEERAREAMNEEYHPARRHDLGRIYESAYKDGAEFALSLLLPMLREATEHTKGYRFALTQCGEHHKAAHIEQFLEKVTSLLNETNTEE